MNSSSIPQFQETVATRLRALHGGVETTTEWSTMRGELGVYSPRLDVAVGPFATGSKRCGREYDDLIRRHGAFLRRAYESSNENFNAFGEHRVEFSFEEVTQQNWNSRCFIAIEIENAVTRKHLMGGAVNAAALGRVGIAVGWTTDKVRAFVKLRTYLLYLGEVGKNTLRPFNLLVLSPAQLLGAIRTAGGNRRKSQIRR